MKITKYWIESSFDFEDKEKEFKEHLIVGVNHQDGSTESIASFKNLDVKIEVEELLKHFNENINYELK